MTAVPATEPVTPATPGATRPAFGLFARLRALLLRWGTGSEQPPGLLAFVLGVDLGGLCGALLVASLLGGAGRADRWSVAAGLLALTAAGELTAVRLRHGEATEDLTLFEAAVVVDVLLLSPGMAVVVPVLALALASLARRRPVVKAAFNLGTYAISTVVMVGTFHVVAGNAAPFAARSVLGLCLGTLTFAAMNLLLLARVLAVVSDVTVREVLADGWQLSAIMAVGNVALGTTVVAIGTSAPTLLPFTALPAVALTFAYRSAAQRADERDRAARLLDLSQALVGRLDAEELVASFLTSARRAFRADRARVVLDVGLSAWPVVVEVDAGGVLRRQATTGDVALLERPSRGQAATLIGDVLPEGWAQALIAPLEAEGLRLGVLVLASDSKSFASGDTALLTPLASALGVALRGAEHLERVVEETSKLKVVVDHSSDGIYVVDGGGRVLLWNPAMSAVTGVAEDEAHGMLSELVHMRDPEGGAVDPLAATFALTPDAPRADVEMALVRPDGEERWVRCSHAGLFDDGRLVRDVVIVHDVTRQREVERLKADFIATVSHELRTPVTPIKGYADLLRRRGDQMSAEKRNECLDIISDRVNHLARLVEDLLLASRISSPRTAVSHDVTLGTGDLVAMTRRAAGDFTNDAARVNLLLPDAPIVVACDPLRVVQVVGNLVSNALKYSPDDTQVDVAISSYDGRARVSVTDRGRGIPADQLEAVFDKFHRVEDPLTMTTSGTGLGLYIARQLARAMDGDVVVRSTLGHGSVFVLILPLAETVDVPPAHPSPIRAVRADTTGIARSHAGADEVTTVGGIAAVAAEATDAAVVPPGASGAVAAELTALAGSAGSAVDAVPAPRAAAVASEPPERPSAVR